jgi:hypothetical protein
MVEKLKLTLQSGGLYRPVDWDLDRFAPELEVYAPQGWRIATVRIATRSAAYVVDLAQVGEHNEPMPDRRHLVPSGLPRTAAKLIGGLIHEVRAAGCG